MSCLSRGFRARVAQRYESKEKAKKGSQTPTGPGSSISLNESDGAILATGAMLAMYADALLGLDLEDIFSKNIVFSQH